MTPSLFPFGFGYGAEGKNASVRHAKSPDVSTGAFILTVIEPRVETL